MVGLNKSVILKCCMAGFMTVAVSGMTGCGGHVDEKPNTEAPKPEKIQPETLAPPPGDGKGGASGPVSG